MGVARGALGARVPHFVVDEISTKKHICAHFCPHTLMESDLSPDILRFYPDGGRKNPGYDPGLVGTYVHKYLVSLLFQSQSTLLDILGDSGSLS